MTKSITKSVHAIMFAALLLTSCKSEGEKLAENEFFKSQMVQNTTLEGTSLSEVKVNELDNDTINTLFSYWPMQFVSDNDSEKSIWDFDDFSTDKDKKYDWEQDGIRFGKPHKYPRTSYYKDIDFHIYENYQYHSEVFQYVGEGNWGLNMQWAIIDEKMVCSIGLLNIIKQTFDISKKHESAFIGLYLSDDITIEDGIITANFTDDEKIPSNKNIPSLKLVIDTNPEVDGGNGYIFPTTVTLDDKFTNTGHIRENYEASSSMMVKWRFLTLSTIKRYLDFDFSQAEGIEAVYKSQN